MSITLKTNQIKLKIQNGNYQAPVVIADQTTSEHVAEVNTAITTTGNQQVSAIQTKGDEVLDSIPEDYTDLVEEVDELKSAIANSINQASVDYGTLVANEYVVKIDGSFAPYSHWSRTGYLDISNYVQIKINFNSNYSAWYDEYKNFISSATLTANTYSDIPDRAVYIAVSDTTVAMNTLFMTGMLKGLELRMNEKIDAVANAKHIEQTKYMTIPQKALFPEFVSKFWCSNILPSALASKQLIMNVSGTAGDTHVSATVVSPETINLSDITLYTGVVLTTDDIAFDVYNVIWDESASALSVYPPLKSTVTNATLAQVYLDSGTTYAGMHLTEYGYKAYAYFLFNQNPKHCEIGLYNEAFFGDTAEESPFVKIKDKPLYLDINNANLSLRWLNRTTTYALGATFASSYTPYNEKNGAYWDVSLNGTSGYLELYVNANANGELILPTGQELHVDVYIDGELAHSETIADTIGRRICVDYENATTGRLEVYSNKWASVNSGSYGFVISSAVWWINEYSYDDNQKIIPAGAVSAMEFDSWGVFHNEALATALHNLLNTDAGVTVDFQNHSLGSQTTAWGLAYWYQNIKAYNPAVALTDFGINDSNSVSSSGIPDTITGPDEKTYNNKITKDMYVANTKKLIAFALNNRIQPLIMRGTQISYNVFPIAVIEALAKKYTV